MADGPLDRFATMTLPAPVPDFLAGGAGVGGFGTAITLAGDTPGQGQTLAWPVFAAMEAGFAAMEAGGGEASAAKLALALSISAVTDLVVHRTNRLPSR